MSDIFKPTETMSSREIAALTGKQHKNVIRDVEILNSNYIEISLLKIEPSEYKSERGKSYPQYLLTKMQCFDLITGYDVKLRIKVNRRWQELEQLAASPIDFNDSNTVLRLAQNWANEEERRKLAESKVAQLQPKADLMDRVLDTGKNIDVGQAAKILDLPFGRNTLFKKLKAKGIFFKDRNEPMQPYIDRGYFLMKEKQIERENHDSFVVIKTLVTQKGLEFVAKLFKSKNTNKQLTLIE